MRAKIIIVITVIILIFTQIFCVGCGYTKGDETDITLCVYADSRAIAATNIANTVASVVSEYIRNELTNVKKADLYSELRGRSECIRAIADSVLRRRGFGYSATVGCNGGNVTVKLGCGNGIAITNACKSDENNALYKSVIAEIMGNS